MENNDKMLLGATGAQATNGTTALETNYSSSGNAGYVSSSSPSTAGDYYIFLDGDMGFFTRTESSFPDPWYASGVSEINTFSANRYDRVYAKVYINSFPYSLSLAPLFTGARLTRGTYYKDETDYNSKYTSKWYFDGWYNDLGTLETRDLTGTVTVTEANQTFHAHWKRVGSEIGIHWNISTADIVAGGNANKRVICWDSPGRTDSSIKGIKYSVGEKIEPPTYFNYSETYKEACWYYNDYSIGKSNVVSEKGFCVLASDQKAGDSPFVSQPNNSDPSDIPYYTIILSVSQAEEVSVTWDFNGGEQTSTKSKGPEITKIKKGDKILDSRPNPDPTKDGNGLKGWYLTKDDANDPYRPIASPLSKQDKAAEDLTVYAGYASSEVEYDPDSEESNRISIFLDPQNETFSMGEYKGETGIKLLTSFLSSALPYTWNATGHQVGKDGYKWQYWISSDNVNINSDDGIWDKTESLTLTAYWKELSALSVVFDPIDGTIDKPKGANLSRGENLVLSAKEDQLLGDVTNQSQYKGQYADNLLPVASLEGYTFEGWYDTDLNEVDSKTKVEPHDNLECVTYHAHYAEKKKEEKTYTVTFNAGNPIKQNVGNATWSIWVGGIDQVTTKYVEKGVAENGVINKSIIVVPQNLHSHKFSGWYEQENGKGNKWTPQTVITKDGITYYAFWESRTIKVTFKSNGKTVVQYDKSYGARLTPYKDSKGQWQADLPIPSGEQVPDNQTFVGWYADVSGLKVEADTKVIFPDATDAGTFDITAKFKEKEDGDGGGSGGGGGSSSSDDDNNETDSSSETNEVTGSTVVPNEYDPPSSDITEISTDTYNVVFHSATGYVYKTETVPYGYSATPPDMSSYNTPYKYFIGWDHQFTRIIEDTSCMSYFDYTNPRTLSVLCFSNTVYAWLKPFPVLYNLDTDLKIASATTYTQNPYSYVQTIYTTTIDTDGNVKLSTYTTTSYSS